ncbi:MAG TPA: hypothetical protein VF520_05910 [Thermoleophilaceae bacterium]
MRRRLRRLARTREALLTELGTLVMEMHRQGRHDAALVAAKAGEVAAIDAEARGLAAALGHGDVLANVIAAGISGACPGCRALIATDDRYCSRCGTPASAASNGHRADAAASVPVPAGTAH